MSSSLQKRLSTFVHEVLAQDTGAWLVWCDPHGAWAPLLRRVAADNRLGAFTLVEVMDETAGEAGSPLARRELQEKLDGGQSLVLLVRAAPDALGWLWAQALRAEPIYDRSLRDQLRDWGWKSYDPSLTDAALATLARQNLAHDPAAWGADTIQPDQSLLIRVLAGLETPSDDNRLVFDRTIESVGLPPIDQTSLTLWRKNALASLLVTQAHHATAGAVPETHERLIAASQRSSTIALLSLWMDSVVQRQYLPAAVAEADPIAHLAPLIAAALAQPAALDALLGAKTPDLGVADGFLSRAAELIAFTAVCKHLAGLEPKPLLSQLAEWHDAFDRRAGGFWGESRPALAAVPWHELARLARAAKLLVEVQTGAWANPTQAIDWYTDIGWRVDRAGEELLRTLDSPGPELTALLSPLREAYRNRWEDLAIRWSETWRAAGYPMAGLPSAGERVKAALAESGATAVIVADALRYDQGATLAEGLNEREGTDRAGVSPARAPLPSITALGMGMALPIAEQELSASLVNGGWQLRSKDQDLNLSQAADRRTWWEARGHVPASAQITLKQALEHDVPAPGGPHARLVIYDDAIDQLGHDDELEAVGAGAIIDRYLAAIGRLREAGWRRVVVTTDHGYIHWSGTAEQQSPPPAPNPAYSNRRALAYPVAALPGAYPLTPGGQYKVAVPAGAAIFRTYGGKGYFHGGGSLQEWVIPVVIAEWPATAKPVEVAIQPLKAVLSMKPKVVLEVTKPSLLVEEALPRRITVVLRNAHTDEILFRSIEATATPDRATVNISLERTKAVAPRGTPLRIEVRDALTEAVIASAETILLLEIDEWADESHDW